MSTCVNHPQKLNLWNYHHHQFADNDIIVAIDFGTSRIGVAWCIIRDSLDPIQHHHIEVQPLDGTDSLTGNNKKTFSAILLSKQDDYKTIAFGQKAKIFYTYDNYGQDYLFSHFKMKLHEQIEMDPKVKAANDETLPLSLVLQKSFEFIKESMLDMLADRGLHMTKDPHKIYWVLTVPAIWRDIAKFIMRKAAFNAGMIRKEISQNLVIALEPECAFISTMNSLKFNEEIYKPNKRFLVIDCGGGTLDITGHQIKTTDPLTVREIMCPDGDYLGSTLVDSRFFDFFKVFLGLERFNAVKNLQEFIEIEKKWEYSKINFSFDRVLDEITRLNLSRIALHENNKHLIKELVEMWNANNKEMNIKLCAAQSIGLPFDLMMSFFDKPVQNIIDKISDVISSNFDQLQFLDYIILSGGFCRNKLLVQRIFQEFGSKMNIKIILQRDPDLLIVKGAALYGSKPNAVFKVRKAKYTYGVRYDEVYHEANKVHQQYKNVRYRAMDGKYRISAIRVHGRIGDNIEVNKMVSKSYLRPMTSSQVDIRVQVYISKHKNPFYINEEGNKCLAEVVVSLDKSLPLRERSICVTFSFGATEVFCSVYKATGEFICNLPLDYSKFFE